MKTPNWFDDGRLGRVHHRFLNDLRSLNVLTTRLHGDPADFVEMVEGDLCWHRDGQDFVLFMMHPDSGNRIPSSREVARKLERGELHTLDAILSDRYSHLKFVIELKTGTGDWKRALRKAVETLEERAPGRYILDGFNPAMLREIKAISPHIPTSLHTRLGMVGSRVIVTHFEPAYVSLPKIASMPFVDVVTITYKYCLPRNFGLDMNRYLAPVLDSGKSVFFGGVNSQEEFDLLRDTKGAKAIYAKFLKSAMAAPV